MHLALMGILMVWSYSGQRNAFLYWAAVTGVFAFIAEWIGVHTGWLFGGYIYGSGLGATGGGIPFLIALNWVTVVAGAASLGMYIAKSRPVAVTAGGLLAASYDAVLEPVAVQYGWWLWYSGKVPLYNYVCWALLAAAFTFLYHRSGIRPNIFALILFCTGAVFFALVQIFFIP
jgi:putative membrane protein